jgi:hypothetical protein
VYFHEEVKGDTRKPAQAKPFGVAAAISAEGDAERQP